MTMYTEYTYNDSLAHHGILGQKWGVLNGPPYPLSYQSHSRTEQKRNSTSRIDGISKHNKPKSSDNRLIKENKKNSKNNVQSNKPKAVIKTASKSITKSKPQLNASNKTETKGKKQLTEKQKKVLKGVAVGAGVAAATGLAIYAYKNNPEVRKAVNNLISNAKNKKLNELPGKSDFQPEIAKELGARGIPMQKRFMKNKGVRTGLDTIHDMKVSNIGSKGRIAYRNHNCPMNAVNLEIRARGGDTIARENFGINSDHPLRIGKNLFSAFKMDREESDRIMRMMNQNMEPSELFNKLGKEPPGSRGIIGCRLFGGGEHDYHFFNYKITPEGDLRFLDGYGDLMFGKTNFSNTKTNKAIFSTNGAMFFRTDNRDIDWDVVTDKFVEANDGRFYKKSKIRKATKILKEIKNYEGGAESEYIQQKYGDILVKDILYKDGRGKWGIGNLYGLTYKK